MDLSSRKIKKYIREGYDLNLISRIQSDIPDFKYDDRYWRQANGYYKIAQLGNIICRAGQKTRNGELLNLCIRKI